VDIKIYQKIFIYRPGGSNTAGANNTAVGFFQAKKKCPGAEAGAKFMLTIYVRFATDLSLGFASYFLSR
jgi:hypothetical protein